MKKFVFAVMTLVMISAPVFAGSFAKYSGPYSLIPTSGPHKVELKGELSLLFDNGQLASVKLVSKDPVFGKTEFLSSEQWLNLAQVNSVQQLVVVFKIQGAPHKWYYVFVGNFANNKFAGAFYKVADTMDKIQTAAKNGVAQIPAGWLEKGSAELTQLVE